jgi:hypothetical protein
MNCPTARALLPDLLDARTPAGAHADARAHLASCPECQREFSALSQTLAALDALPTPAPTPRLRTNFYAMLEEEKHSAASVRSPAPPLPGTRRAARFAWLLSPLAACALVALGFLAGARTAPTASPAGEDATARKFAQLEKQLGDMKKLMAISIIQQQQASPTNERLQEVLVAARTENASEKVLNDLLAALAFDPSANVRLRALEALYPHADHQAVRAGILATLPREQNPLVQLEMIDFVASAHDRAAAPALEKIAQNAAFDRSVRDAARRALAQL